jgi:hypothetical protein
LAERFVFRRKSRCVDQVLGPNPLKCLGKSIIELVFVITLDNQLGSLNVKDNNDIVPGSSRVITRLFMSSRSISRTECMPARSLADLLATLGASDLPERKRQELASAIRTVARALGRSPETIPADGRLLAGRLKEVAPAALGISAAGGTIFAACYAPRWLAFSRYRRDGIRMICCRSGSHCRTSWVRDRTRLRCRGCCGFYRRGGSRLTRSRWKLSTIITATSTAHC